MKTSPEQKIKDDIRREYAKTYPNCIFSLTNYVERLKAELAALEADNAAEKNRRIYYQDIVYDACNQLDRFRRRGGFKPARIASGTVDAPCREVQDALRAALTPDSGKETSCMQEE